MDIAVKQISALQNQLDSKNVDLQELNEADDVSVINLHEHCVLCFIKTDI